MIEKPRRGDFLPILDGGFSLQFAPLMEYREGKGMMLLCQVDVSGRSEAEPAAETLVRNVFQYVSAWKPPTRRRLAYAGEAAGKAYLESLGLLGECGGRRRPCPTAISWSWDQARQTRSAAIRLC